MKTIKEEWENFEAQVISPEAPPIQREEMEKAFYAGSFALMSMQMRMADADVTDEEGANQMESWNNECIAFKDKVVSGS